MGDFFKHIGEAAKNVGKKTINNPGRALELAANIGTAAASKNPRMIAATAPDNIKFVHQGKGLYLGKIHKIFGLKMSSIHNRDDSEKVKKIASNKIIFES